MRFRNFLLPSLAMACATVLSACNSKAASDEAKETATKVSEASPAMAAPVAPPANGGGDALVAGTNFHATGTLPCARYAGQPTSPCRFGVTRAGDGSATVTIFWPGGGQRAIFFDTAGKPSGFDANQADGSAKARLTTRRDADLNLIAIGSERYEIPDAVVVGG